MRNVPGLIHTNCMPTEFVNGSPSLGRESSLGLLVVDGFSNGSLRGPSLGPEIPFVVAGTFVSAGRSPDSSLVVVGGAFVVVIGAGLRVTGTILAVLGEFPPNNKTTPSTIPPNTTARNPNSQGIKCRGPPGGAGRFSTGAGADARAGTGGGCGRAGALRTGTGGGPLRGGACSASTNARHVGQRSSGFLASARATAGRSAFGSMSSSGAFSMCPAMTCA